MGGGMYMHPMNMGMYMPPPMFQGSMMYPSNHRHQDNWHKGAKGGAKGGGKGGGKGAKGGAKGGGKGGSGKRVCKYFFLQGGCNNGASCNFSHESVGGGGAAAAVAVGGDKGAKGN